jgi:erythromycin esterase
MEVPASRPGSVEETIHRSLDADAALFVVPPERPRWLAERRDHRAIGVVYDPARERWGNYVATVLGRRYDAFCWFRRTRALELIGTGDRPEGELQTWPEGQ